LPFLIKKEDLLYLIHYLYSY